MESILWWSAFTIPNSRNNGNAESAQKNIFVPFTTFQQAFNYGDTVGWMALTANDDASITQLKPKILDFMRARHSIHPQDERAIGKFDLYEEFSKVQDLFSILKFIAYFVGTLVLISGVIGISNIMLIVVKERTKEIGIRRALGATPMAIRSQILLESIFLTITAGMLGIATATGLLALLNKALDGHAQRGHDVCQSKRGFVGSVFCPNHIGWVWIIGRIYPSSNRHKSETG